MATPNRTRDRLAAIALFAGTALLYAQVAGFAFTFFDDPRYVTENARVQAGLSWANARWALTTLSFSNWHPLTWLSYMLDAQLFGVRAGAFHLVNALLHAANAALLYLVVARMTGARARSAFVAAVFAAHPLHVESVAWVAERKDLLSTLFGLLALLGYLRYVERPGLGRYLAVTLAFALSLAAKPMWVTFPFLLLLLDAWPMGRLAGWPEQGKPSAGGPPPVPLRRSLLEKTPWLLLSAASSILTVTAQGRGGAMVAGLGLGQRLANAAVSYGRYLAMMFWPIDLAAFYPIPPGGPTAAEVASALALLLAVTALALWQLRRHPWLAVGWAWFLGTLVPVIGIVQVGAQAMADRYTYLPSIGITLAVTWAACSVAGRWNLGAIRRPAAVAVTAILAVLTVRQTAYWSDHVTLFRHAIQVTGPNPRAHAYLSDGLRKAGRLDEAIAEAQAAIRIEPGSGRLRLSLAIVEVDLGRLRDARRSLQAALALDPKLAFAWALLGEVETALGQPGEGERLLVEAVRLAPDDDDIADRLARVRAYRASSGR